MSETTELRAISSMATKAVLGDLTKRYFQETGIVVSVESVGGVDASKRIQSGEHVDIVLLGRDAIDRLVASGHVIASSCRDWVLSPVGIAVKSGATRWPIHNAKDVQQAVLASPRISYSTGPSGVYLEKLFAHWGISEQIQSSLIVPAPGTPVGSLVAEGKVDLGFQQLSELLPIQGIDILGTLPSDIAYITKFAAGIPVVYQDDEDRLENAYRFIEFIASSEVNSLKEQHGMSGV